MKKFVYIFLLMFFILAGCKDFWHPEGPSNDGNGKSTIYTIRYSRNGADGIAPSAQTAASGTSVTVAGQGNLSYFGHEFNGWNTDSSGLGTPYGAGETLYVSGDIYLYAQWKSNSPTSYTITYNANGASGTPPSPQTVASGETFFVTVPTSLSYPGKSFSGWNTKSDGTGISYPTGKTYKPYNDIELFAQWTSAE